MTDSGAASEAGTMRLSDLEALEQAYIQRGWRVALTTPDGSADELTTNDGRGWSTVEEAQRMADRLSRIAPIHQYRVVGVVGPDGAPPVSSGTALLSPDRAG